MERENLIENSATLGTYFLRKLRERVGEHPHVGSVHGEGLMLAVEFVADKKAKRSSIPSESHRIVARRASSMASSPAALPSSRSSFSPRSVSPRRRSTRASSSTARRSTRSPRSCASSPTCRHTASTGQSCDEALRWREGCEAARAGQSRITAPLEIGETPDMTSSKHISTQHGDGHGAESTYAWWRLLRSLLLSAIGGVGCGRRSSCCPPCRSSSASIAARPRGLIR